MNTLRVGNAPVSWVSAAFAAPDGQQIRYPQMLDELVEAGYTGTELGDWGFMPTDPAVLGAALNQRHLTMLGAYVGVALKNPSAHANGEAHAVEVARLLADVARLVGTDHQPFLVLADDNGADPGRTKNAGRITPELGLSGSEWRTFTSGAERIARAVQLATSLRTVFHPHCAGYVETPDEIARFLQMTDPGLLGLVFDTGHYAFGAGSEAGHRLLRNLNLFGDRVQYVHFKDCDFRVTDQARAAKWDYSDAARHGVFPELGRGGVDFSAVVAWLRNHRYEGWIVVEQDFVPGMGAPSESARRSREFLRTLGL